MPGHHYISVYCYKLLFLDFGYKWNPSICGLSWLASPTLQTVFEAPVHGCVWSTLFLSVANWRPIVHIARVLLMGSL